MKMTTEELVAVLDDIKKRVQEKDSFEGSISYEKGDEKDSWEVVGAYRLGNSQGQGSVRVWSPSKY